MTIRIRETPRPLYAEYKRAVNGHGDPGLASFLTEAMEPYFREAGSGEPVVCIHSNAANSGQWRTLMDLLSAKRRVIAPDSLGAGKSPAWPQDRVVMLRDEVALLEPVFCAGGQPDVAGWPLIRRRSGAGGRPGDAPPGSSDCGLRAHAVLAAREGSPGGTPLPLASATPWRTQARR